MTRTPTSKHVSFQDTKSSEQSPESDLNRTGRSYTGSTQTGGWWTDGLKSVKRTLSPPPSVGRNISAAFESLGLSNVNTASTDVPNATSASHPANSKSSESDSQIKPEAEALALSVRRILQDSWSKTDKDSQKMFNDNMPGFPSDGRSPPECFWLWDLQGTHSVAGWVGLDKDGRSVNVTLSKENLGPPEQFGHPGFLSIQTVIGGMGGPIGSNVRARLDMPQPLKLGSRHFVIKSCEMGSMVVNEAKQLVLFVGFRPASAAEVENFLIA
jgi:hypothetical protein